MKVILKQNYRKLGKSGEAVNVKDGYAMNYLIPNGIALTANEGNLRVLENLNKQRAKKIQKAVEDSSALKGQLEAELLEIKANAGEEGKLFGSVTAHQVADALKERNYTIDKKQVVMEEHIKTTGEHTVLIDLGNGVEANVKVNVTAITVE